MGPIRPYHDAACIDAEGPENVGHSADSKVEPKECLALDLTRSWEDPNIAAYEPGDADSRVYLNMEAAKNVTVKVALISVMLAIPLSFGALLAVVIVREMKGEAPFLVNQLLFYFNLVIGCVCLVATVISLVWWLWRLWRVGQTNRTWTDDRRRVQWLQGAKFFTQLLGLVALIVPNAYAVANSYCFLWNGDESYVIDWCAFFQWTYYNMFFFVMLLEADRRMLYGQSSKEITSALGKFARFLKYNGFKALLFVATQGVLIAFLVCIIKEGGIENLAIKLPHKGHEDPTPLLARQNVTQTIKQGMCEMYDGLREELTGLGQLEGWNDFMYSSEAQAQNITKEYEALQELAAAKPKYCVFFGAPSSAEAEYSYYYDGSGYATADYGAEGYDHDTEYAPSGYEAAEGEYAPDGYEAAEGEYAPDGYEAAEDGYTDYEFEYNIYDIAAIADYSNSDAGLSSEEKKDVIVGAMAANVVSLGTKLVQIFYPEAEGVLTNQDGTFNPAKVKEFIANITALMQSFTQQEQTSDLLQLSDTAQMAHLYLRQKCVPQIGGVSSDTIKSVAKYTFAILRSFVIRFNNASISVSEKNKDQVQQIVNFGEIPPYQKQEAMLTYAFNVFVASSDANADMKLSARLTALSVTFAGLCGVYFVLYFYYTIAAFVQLSKMPFNKHRLDNMFVRYKVRLNIVVIFLFAATILLEWFIHFRSTTSMLITMMGIIPLEFLATVIIIASTVLLAPSHNTVPNSFFYWQERRSPSRSGPNGPVPSLYPNDFCFETALKSAFWATKVYRPVDDETFSNDLACDMYGLHEVKEYHDEDKHVRAFLGKGPTQMVVAFRGTQTTKNAYADLMAWQVAHPPERGNIFTRPRVHAGFSKSWHKTNIRDPLLAEIEQHLAANPGCEVLVTGHSLGGAISHLASFDMKKRCPNVNITVYTFGVPRAGNTAFCKEYDALIPECYNVINDQDVVTKIAKFGGLYKRPGKRVLVNNVGQLVLTPSFLENNVLQRPGASALDHLMGNYRGALRCIMQGQFCGKGFASGDRGVQALFEDSATSTMVSRAFDTDEDKLMSGAMDDPPRVSTGKIIRASLLRVLFFWKVL